jgi:hypothetical protein
MTAPKKNLGHCSACQKTATQNMTSKCLDIEPEPLSSSTQVSSENSAEASDELVTAERNLDEALATVNHHKTELETAKAKAVELYQVKRVVTRKLQRTLVSKNQLREQVKLLQNMDLPNARNDAVLATRLFQQADAENAKLKQSFTSLLASTQCTANLAKEKQLKVEARLKSAQKTNHILQKHLARIPDIKSTAAKRAKNSANKENCVLDLKSKGAYHPKARELAHALTVAGSSQKYVSTVIQTVCQHAGVTVRGQMSRRTVKRAIEEGGIMAEIQLGHELTHTKGNFSILYLLFFTKMTLNLAFTGSIDGTTNKSLNFDSRHIAFENPFYNPADSKYPKHVNHFMRLRCTVDTSSEAEIQDWVAEFQHLLTRYQSSSFGQ